MSKSASSKSHQSNKYTKMNLTIQKLSDEKLLSKYHSLESEINKLGSDIRKKVLVQRAIKRELKSRNISISASASASASRGGGKRKRKTRKMKKSKRKQTRRR